MEIQKIMVVDDDRIIRKLVEISLSRIGNWSVKTVESGAKAIEELVTYKPDLILLDAMMPGLDGPSTFKMLQEDSRTASIPVIFLTAKVQKDEVDDYRCLGAAGVISKPFDPLSLPDQIRQVLERLESEPCLA